MFLFFTGVLTKWKHVFSFFLAWFWVCPFWSGLGYESLALEHAAEQQSERLWFTRGASLVEVCFRSGFSMWVWLKDRGAK